MKRFLLLAALVASPVHAAPAVVFSTVKGGAVCGMLDSRGGSFTATHTTVVYSDGSVSYRCQGYQGFSAGRRVVYNTANLGAQCAYYVGGAGDCVPVLGDPTAVTCTCSEYQVSTRWQETISASGQAEVTCVVVPEQSEMVVTCP